MRLADWMEKGKQFSPMFQNALHDFLLSTIPSSSMKLLNLCAVLFL